MQDLLIDEELLDVLFVGGVTAEEFVVVLGRADFPRISVA